MADAAARGVDAALIVELSKEIGRGVDLVAIGERAGVEVAEDGGADGVVDGNLAVGEIEVVRQAMGRLRLVIIDGIERHQTTAIGIADILGDGKGEVEHTLTHAVGSLIERLRAVFIDEGGLSTLRRGVVEFADDGLLSIADGGRHDTLEVCSHFRATDNMTRDFGDGACTEGDVRACGLTVDAVDHHLYLWTSQREGRITQKSVLQFVGRDVAPCGNKVTLRLSCSLTDGVTGGEDIVSESEVHRLVVVSIDSSCGTKEGHTPTLLTQHHGLADIVFLSVEGHNVARGRKPQGQMIGGGSLEVGELHHQFMGEGVRRTVTIVIHKQGTVGHLLFDLTGSLRIGIACSGRDTLVGIPVDLLHLIARIVILNEGGHTVGGGHMGVVIAVVTHHTDDILPRASKLVGGITERLVDEHFCLIEGSGGITAYGHIGLAFIRRTVLDHFPIVEEAEEIIADVTTDVAERVLALETEQEVVRVIVIPIATKHTVIPGTVAKEQEIAWLIVVCFGTVVEHLHISAVGCGIRGSAGKLIIKFIGRDDPDTHTAVILMPSLDTFGL